MPSALIALVWLTWLLSANAQQPSSEQKSGDFSVPVFHFEGGSTLAQVTLHYTTLGRPRHDASGRTTNAVLLLHDVTDTGRAFLTVAMRRELFAPGQPLDVNHYFIIIPDALGRGGSSKPSDGMGTKFPQYGYNDIVNAQYLLVTRGLSVDHLRLVLGTSMGGMQTWLWGERHPDMMDGLVPIASQPVALTGRNGFWRQMIVDAIRRDPGWNDGYYTLQPMQWLHAMPIFTLLGDSAARMQALAPTQNTARWLYDASVYRDRQYDANDVLYWFESSWDYDPEASLSSIKARLYAVNFADDLMKPIDIGVMQRVMQSVSHGRFVEIHESESAYGNQAIAHPEVWKKCVIDLMQSLPKE